jgi:hypothetical protein
MVLVTFNDKKNVMKKSGLFCLGILLSLSIQAQVIGKMFPEMEAETVEDKKQGENIRCSVWRIQRSLRKN